MIRNALTLTSVLALLAACASGPERREPSTGGETARPDTSGSRPPQTTPPKTTPPAGSTAQPPAEPTMALQHAAFSDLPGWDRAAGAEGLAAFRRHCAVWERRGDYKAVYAGVAVDWRAACTAAATTAPEDARAFWEANFNPWRIVSTGGEAKLTSYYAPRLEARRAPEPGFTEPLRTRPSDMLTVDLDAFEQRLGASWAAAAPSSVVGRLEGSRIVPYLDRAGISARDRTGFSYLHPADAYNLQVQGSARLRYPDGAETCVGFAAQNGYRWRSALGALNTAGKLTPNPNGLWAAMRDYFDRNPGEVTAALNADPSYVFFQEDASLDACPRGSSGVIVTDRGSLAIDPKYHAYGTPLFVSAPAAGELFPRVVVAQDTGGAIRRGPLRGDFFAGIGAEAGAVAERISVSNPEFYALLPKDAGPPAGPPQP